jgi:hypothetical protein
MVHGTVIDEQGEPVEGARVEQYGLYYGDWKPEDEYSMKYIKQPTFEGYATSDENGEFSLKLLEGNKYRLNPYLAGPSYKDLVSGDKLDIIAQDGLKPVTFVLKRKPK